MKIATIDLADRFDDETVLDGAVHVFELPLRAGHAEGLRLDGAMPNSGRRTNAIPASEALGQILDVCCIADRLDAPLATRLTAKIGLIFAGIDRDVDVSKAFDQ